MEYIVLYVYIYKHSLQEYYVLMSVFSFVPFKAEVHNHVKK